MPNAKSRRLPLALLLLLFSVLPKTAYGRTRSTSQFQDFPPAWRDELLFIRDNKCIKERDAYKDASNPDYWAAFELADCLLTHTKEFYKIEMGVVTMMLGLFPSIVMFIGPSTDEIALLMMRRPVLALLLAVGQPVLRLQEAPIRQVYHLERKADSVSQPTGRNLINEKGVIFTGMVSALEYILASVAVANLVYSSYKLIFLATTVSAIAIRNLAVSQVYGPPIWFFLIIVVNLLGYVSFKLRYTVYFHDNGHGTYTWHERLLCEMTPCIQQTGLRLQRRKDEDILLKRWPHLSLKLVQRASSFLCTTGILALYIYATVIMSSQIFISLGDVVVLLVPMLLLALASRCILHFELGGMTSASEKEDTGFTGR